MQLPTMVIAGAQKSGTTTLVAGLRRHPQILLVSPKELHFFDHDSKYARGLDWYRSRFEPKPQHVHAGEATPVYMYSERARARMAEALPDAKIAVILRDPAKRAYSHYWHVRRLGGEPIETFEEALAAEPQRLATGNHAQRMRWSYVDRGRYIDQVLDLERNHGRHNLHVMLMEDLTRDPEATFAGLLEFLGLDPAGAADLPLERRNVYRVPDERGEVKPAEYPPMRPATRAAIVEELRDHNDRMASWLGRDLSAWNEA